MLGNVDLADPNQAGTAIDVVNTMVSGGGSGGTGQDVDTRIVGNIYPTPVKASTSSTTTTTTETPPDPDKEDTADDVKEEKENELVDTMEKYLRLIRKMTDVSRLPSKVYPHEYNVRMGISQSVGKLAITSLNSACMQTT